MQDNSVENTPLQEVSRRDWKAYAVPVLALIGIFVAGYLSYIHWFPESSLCGDFGDCETVNLSRWATIRGVPIALLGMGMYVLILGLSIYRLRSQTETHSMIAPAIFGLSLFGVLYSAYLTYLELFVIHAICPYCVASAIIVTLIFGLSVRDMEF
ncbi:MAG: vitamin K epoxide reductase family protein [Chloroflexi bacterium]|nr:vitamin K epoxide reductase family protein [Chloroflexota bacterium]